ncbi:MAG TPA: cyclic nucleotide-binding domain-containing protein [Gammaproteobacteria bacterium]|nr:cyclic nucleotide-binding domain-containing protein [Gammaproteobacteria bacterium]
MPRRAALVRSESSPEVRLGLQQLARLARLPGGPLLILQGDRLARYGHPFYDLYAVCSGLIEASITNAVGYRKVLGRYRPGEIIGLDAIVRGTYPADFLALEPSTVCAIPLSVADQYISDKPAHH